VTHTQNDIASTKLSYGSYKLQGVFRFFLAMMVLWSHSTAKIFPELREWFAELQLGNAAVSAFFVLSGYLMSEAIRMWYSGRLLSFISNRYLRISPPLFVAAALSVTIHFTLSHFRIRLVGLEDIPRDAISIHNAVASLLEPLFPLNIPIGKVTGIFSQQPAYAFVRYSWAIFTELMFYWMLVLFFASLRFFGSRITTYGFACGVGTMFALGTANYHGLFHGTAIANRIDHIPFVNNFQWTPHFLIGSLISYCSRKKWSQPTSIAGLITVSCLALLQFYLYVGQGYSNPFPPLCLFIVILVTGFGAILSGRQELSFGAFRLTAQHDQAFGSLSYPIYINQFSLSIAMLSIFVSVTGVELIDEIAVGTRVFFFIAFNFLIIGLSAGLIFLTDTVTDQLRDRIRASSIQPKPDRTRQDTSIAYNSR
jgi:peptidoglycan/LPS O-acetylase OafA/YrhL